MDLKKLPRLSETDKHAPPPKAPAEAELPVPSVDSHDRDYDPQPEAFSRGPEVWISIAVGVILLLMYPRFLQWASSGILGTHFNEFKLPDGTVVPYHKVPEFWADLGPTLFGFLLIVEGIALAFSQRRSVLWAAFVLTLIATGYNLMYLVLSYSEYGLPIVSALAVAFGIYIAMYQWKLLNLRRA